MQTTIKVSCPVSFGTHYRASRNVIARGPIALLSYGFFVGLPLLALGIMVSTGSDITSPSVLGLPTWAGLLLGPAFVFLFLPLCQILNVWQMRRRNPSVHGVFTFTLNDDGFEVHGGVFEVKLRWAAIHRVIETKGFFLFYVSTAMAHFIPKSCVNSMEEMQAIRKIIQQAVGHRAKLQAT